MDETSKDALDSCPFCGSGPARQPGRYTQASFSGVEVLDETNQPYVWCGTCCARMRVCDSISEAIAAWNTRAVSDAGECICPKCGIRHGGGPQRDPEF